MLPQLQRASLILLLCAAGASAASIPPPARYEHLASDLLPRDEPVTKSFYLRIAPLGASITNGYLSTDGNGYRKYLRDELRYNGWAVNMVGSLQTGMMNDNDNEGHLGWTIQQVMATALPNIVTDQPNLVLINAGTNNAIQNKAVSTASDLFIELLDALWEGIPGATVILSTLLRNKDATTDANAVTINTQIRETVIPHYQALGRPIVLADMADGFITQDDLNDDTHPLDEGYKKMASVWWAAFQTVEAAGYLTAPPDTGVSDNATTSSGDSYTCDKVYGDGDGNYQIQRGSGTDDGNYVHTSVDEGVVWTNPYPSNTTDDNLARIFFAQLVNAGGTTVRGGEVDEIVWALYQNDYWYWLFWVNNNDNDFDTSDGVFVLPYNCAPEASRFGDLNNDGLDDYICIDADGNLWAAMNRGGNPPTFEGMGIIGAAPDFWATDGYTASLVHMADIDGDGRVDWCILLHSGDVSCKRNGGSGDVPTPSAGGYWQDFAVGLDAWTTVFPSQNKGNAAGVSLIDINGDFKTDWLFMDETGQVETYINNRGTGSGLVPDWRSAGITHGGLSPFGVTNANAAVKFGRMYGTGRRDYIWVQEKNSTEDGTVQLTIRVWKNTGAGGTILKGDGSTYCDMDGDGKDDYIWVGPTGQIDIYRNTDSRPYWDNHLGVADLGVARKTIQVADLDGDGLCDLLSVDRTTGAVRMWRTAWDSTTKTFSFTDHGVVSGAAGCTQGYGVLENDLGVRFADLTADGKADYLCIETDGRVTGYINEGMTTAGAITFTDVGQIKLATNYDRQNTRFNDVNGDGRADLIWLNKYNGHATVWYNGGEIETSGSAFSWLNQGLLYKGWDRGANMHFGALGGQHRADMIQVIPRTNLAYISYNLCAGGGGGGDDADMGDPDLPAYGGASSSNTTCPSGSVCATAAFSFPDTTCTAAQQAQLTAELQYALEMALYTQEHLQTGAYYANFFSSNLRLDEDFAANTQQVYANVALMLQNSGFALRVSCDATTDYCVNRNWLAHMADDPNKRGGQVNLCSRFFGTELGDTAGLLGTCQQTVPTIVQAQRTRSAVLVHEMTHTSFAMSFQAKTRDYAYGYTFCTKLADGKFDRSCMASQLRGETRVLCPSASDNTVEGTCDADLSAANADTYSFVAAGVWYSDQCQNAITLPALAATTDDACPASDYVLTDMDDGLGKYVHFGDSYAAGMGTGKTSTDSCRVGSNNYGSLLNGSVAFDDYERLACSGDSLTGVAKQITTWSNPADTSVATLSVGGNDINFSALVKACVIKWVSASNPRQKCIDLENVATSYMQDTDTSGLRYKLKQTYVDIVQKAGTLFFQLYVTSYVTFFNDITLDCNLTSFEYWNSGYNVSDGSDELANSDGHIVLLTDLRAELDTLVQLLNSVISGAVDDANDALGTAQVHFVDVNPYYDDGAHRWCENPNAEFHEPNPDRDDTWWFLSAWKDVAIDGSADGTAAEDAAEVASIMAAGYIAMPDPATCTDALGTDPDPYAVNMCEAAIAITQYPDSDMAKSYSAAEADVAAQNFSSTSISWWLPTRQIKTFHPRSPGMGAYRDAIMAAMADEGQI